MAVEIKTSSAPASLGKMLKSSIVNQGSPAEAIRRHSVYDSLKTLAAGHSHILTLGRSFFDAEATKSAKSLSAAAAIRRMSDWGWTYTQESRDRFTGKINFVFLLYLKAYDSKSIHWRFEGVSSRI